MAKKQAKGVKETVGAVVGKIPAWLKRLQSELEKLIEKLVKLDAMLEKLETLVALKKATKEDKENLRLLKKQKKAMVAYRDVLEERLCKAEASR